MLGYLEKGIQTPMAQGRSTKIISMIKWVRSSRLSVKNSLSAGILRGASVGSARSSLTQQGTSLLKKRTPLGPCRGPVPRVRGGSLGGGRFLMGEEPLYTVQVYCVGLAYAHPPWDRHTALGIVLL